MSETKLNGLYKKDADGIFRNVFDGTPLNGDQKIEKVAENNLNEKEGGQRNFGDNYKEQELYYASEEYKETLEPYEKSLSGNNVNSDNASKDKKFTDESASEQRNKLLQQKRLGRYQTRTRGGVLRYPLEALTEHTDYLQIDIEKYEPIGDTYTTAPGSSKRYVKGNIFTNRAGRRPASKLSTKPLINAGTILLPIPANIGDSNNVQYDSSTLNGLAAVGVQAASGFMETDFTQGFSGGLQQLNDLRKDIAERIKQGTGSTAAATNIINKKLASEAVNIFGANVTVNQLLARGNGEILNPNMELLFGGPTLRNFKFQFKFTPRNTKESEQVKLIIRAFKRNMAPQAQGGDLGSGNWFLRTPNVFKIRYRTGRNDHPFLNKFKQCFLSDMSTTYTGDGVYATYDDATPVSIIMDLSFKEIQPIYDIDYDERPGTGAVGY